MLSEPVLYDSERIELAGTLVQQCRQALENEGWRTHADSLRVLEPVNTRAKVMLAYEALRAMRVGGVLGSYVDVAAQVCKSAL